MASSLQTTALGSLMNPVLRRGLPAPSAAFIPVAGPMGPVKPLVGGPDYSRFNRPTGGSNAEGHTPGRGASVGEIMSQREGRSNAYDPRTGQPVTRGTVLNASGWNTSGVGPGTAGYRGSWRPGGYNFGEGTRRPTGQLGFGGLNDFYQQQQGLNQWDRLQGQRAMDQQDAVGSEMAQRARIAAQNGDYETAAQFAQAVSDRAAQRLATQGSPFNQGGSTFGGMTSGGAPMVLPGSQAEINAFSPMGAPSPMAQSPAEPPQLDPNSWEAQAMLDQAALDDRIPISRFATGIAGPSSGPSTFTNAQGSLGPGGTQSNYGGVQLGPQFFQDAANRQGVKNEFAKPQSGFGGTVASDLDSYAQKLMAAKQRLGKK